MKQLESYIALSVNTPISADFLHPIELLRGRHEREREFCGQLGILANDIWQLGHEKLASSLLDIATGQYHDQLGDPKRVVRVGTSPVQCLPGRNEESGDGYGFPTP